MLRHDHRQQRRQEQQRDDPRLGQASVVGQQPHQALPDPGAETARVVTRTPFAPQARRAYEKPGRQHDPQALPATAASLGRNRPVRARDQASCDSDHCGRDDERDQCHSISSITQRPCGRRERSRIPREACWWRTSIRRPHHGTWTASEPPPGGSSDGGLSSYIRVDMTRCDGHAPGVKYDAIVLGAGPAGLGAALALARDGQHVALRRGWERGRRVVPDDPPRRRWHTTWVATSCSSTTTARREWLARIAGRRRDLGRSSGGVPP